VGFKIKTLRDSLILSAALLARFTVGLSEGLYQTSYYALIGYVFFRKRGLAMGLFSGLFAVGIAITPPPGHAILLWVSQ
jgi:MFS family permease